MTDETKEAMSALRKLGWSDDKIAKALGGFTADDVKTALGPRPERPPGEAAAIARMNEELRRSTDPDKRRI